MFGSGSDSFRTTDSSSPACNSLSPPVKEESLEGHTSEEGDRDRICSPAERSPDVPGFRREFYLNKLIKEKKNLLFGM